MELERYVEELRRQVLLAAEAGGDEARLLAERLIAPLDAATRLVLLEAISAAADEITRDLAPGSVEVRLHGRSPSFVVVPAPEERAFAGVAGQALDAQVEADEGGTSRINLRLPDALKARAEDAAGRERLSVNAWLVRAVTSALSAGGPDGGPSRRGRDRQRYTGWVR